MEVVAQVRIVLWEGASLWVVDATPAASRQRQSTDLHAHHAIQLVIGLGGDFTLRTADRHVSNTPVAVAADTGHLFEADGRIALLFVEPESRAGQVIRARLFARETLAAVPAGVLDDLAARLAAAASAGADDTAFAEIGRSLVACLAGEGGHRPDLRVRGMIAAAKQRLEGPVSLADVVGVGGLSEGRLRHLFVEQTGLPFKTYLLWLRLTRAVERIIAGASLTQAAHDAGFADSAHFSRTFKRMFGVAPAALRMT